MVRGGSQCSFVVQVLGDVPWLGATVEQLPDKLLDGQVIHCARCDLFLITSKKACFFHFCQVCWLLLRLQNRGTASIDCKSLFGFCRCVAARPPLSIRSLPCFLLPQRSRYGTGHCLARGRQHRRDGRYDQVHCKRTKFRCHRLVDAQKSRSNRTCTRDQSEHGNGIPPDSPPVCSTSLFWSKISPCQVVVARCACAGEGNTVVSALRANHPPSWTVDPPPSPLESKTDNTAGSAAALFASGEV